MRGEGTVGDGKWSGGGFSVVPNACLIKLFYILTIRVLFNACSLNKEFTSGLL